MGTDYWKEMYEWMKDKVLETDCNSKEYLKMIHLTDDPKVVADGIERHYQRTREPVNF